MLKKSLLKVKNIYKKTAHAHYYSPLKIK